MRRAASKPARGPIQPQPRSTPPGVPKPAGPGRLARLDGRAVPRLAQILRAFGRTGRGLGSSTGSPGRAVVRLVRRQPTISVTVVVVALAVGLLLGTGGDQQHSVAPTTPRPTASLPGDELGPATGEQVSAYLSQAQLRRALLSGEVTSRPVTAVVDFIGYLTPAAVGSVLQGASGVQVIRGFAQVAPPAAGDVHTITLMPGSDLASDLALDHANAETVVANYRKLVRYAAANPTQRAQSLVKAYAPQADQARVDAAGLGARAGCVFALVVTGSPSQLQTLAANPEVRVLDPAPVAVPLAGVMIVPLQPQVTQTVSALTFAGG